jgi:UDP-N-acetylglucosamine transferase subunit ALG13
MILVTVGMQIPFNRLCKAVDDWAGTRNRNDVFIQTGETDWIPKNSEHTKMIRPDEFRGLMEKADLLIMHVGVGSIVTASDYGIPMILMPRRESLHETRNDHQYHAALRMRNTPGISVVMNEDEVPVILDQFDWEKKPEVDFGATSPELIQRVSGFIQG